MIVTATNIHNGKEWLPEGYAIETDESGKIISILDHIPTDAVQYKGIICAGFVNVHCHTELSHMKGVIPKHTRLIPFLQTVSLHRNDHTQEQKDVARHNALLEMLANGIVAVGDIANTTDSLDIRAMDKMHFHTFVESIGFTPANAERSIQYASNTLASYTAQQEGKHKLRQGITPHAPYSVSSELFRLIDKYNPGGPIAIHNQESAEEDLFYKVKEGAVRELLSSLGIDDSSFTPSGMSSLHTYLQWMSYDKPFIFVHNTFTTAEDIAYARQLIKDVYWCLCPNANMYIENRLPDIALLSSGSDNICIGTDSLASNDQLSILAELNTIKQHRPETGWGQMLRWATWNGAKALGMEDTIGSIEPGKEPGLLLLSMNTEGNEAQVKRLI